MTRQPIDEKLASDQLERRRGQVRRAVRKWRVTHKEQYNAYCREYMRRPDVHARHLARCKKYRERKRLERVEREVHDVAVPPSKVDEQAC